MKLVPDLPPFEVLAKSSLEGLNPKHHYLRSYPMLLQATEKLCASLGSDAIPVIAHLAYGWMPTILTYHFDNAPNEHLILSRQASDIPSGIAIVQAVQSSPVNNSWVGLSKVLHFLNPRVFPIWDSRVALNFGISGHYNMKKKSMYIDYMRFVSTKIQDPQIHKVQSVFASKVGYNISAVRACEWVLFRSSPEQSSGQSNEV